MLLSVGFILNKQLYRHYLEYVSNLIGDWTIQEEAKYQAKLLAKEVEDSQKEFDDEKQKAQAADRKSRSKSPKKSPGNASSRYNYIILHKDAKLDLKLSALFMMWFC